MPDKHILITGGFGYVGSRLTPHLLELGHRVRVIDRLLYSDAGVRALHKYPSWPKWSGRFSFSEADIRDPQAVQAALKGVDTVIHLAAISNDPTGDIDEVLTRQVNFDAIGMLVALARKAGVQRFINASSSSVFGARDESEIDELLEPAPLTFYSKYKMLSEWLLTAAASPDFCTVNIRPATICGTSPRQRFDLTVNKLTADAITKRLITVHGGEQRRPNVGMSDIIHLYAQLVETDPALINGQTFNFGFENLKVIEIAKLIQTELSDMSVEIKITDTQDHRDYHISSNKILKTLGYKPVSSIRNEVKLLRAAIEAGQFPDVDAPEHYNMKFMKLGRDARCYDFLKK
ncbi:MAG: NAD-dependent epimerase/dehydratase [Methylacidiphilales bacterium]|nr:NAD-dependent epimerase/dehydratase [Candidatus Methylacidiphilales bacterium]